MKETVPNYYPAFRCLAADCRHSCCIGWEIDIDEDSLARHDAVSGPMGQRLQESIDRTDTPHFRLDAEERCPFLNVEGLCDLICTMGEDALCQICADHPRFRNCFSHCTELGLGLVCEGAAELVLSQTAPMELICLSDDGTDCQPDEDEAELLQLRRTAMQIAQDRGFSIWERMEHLTEFFDLPIIEDAKRWAKTYLALERLDKGWTVLLKQLEAAPPAACCDTQDLPAEQLLVYFLYRHVPAALWDGDPYSKIAFAVLSTHMILWLHAATELPLQELARMYSGEVEYSDENLEILWDALNE